MKLSVSAQAMSVIDGSELSNNPVAYDGGTEGAREAYRALRDARPQRWGKGVRYLLDVTPEGAAVIGDYCDTVGQGLAGESEAETRSDGRALLLVAARVNDLLAKTTERLVYCSAHGHYLVSASVTGTTWTDDRAGARRYTEDGAAAAAEKATWLDHNPTVEGD